MWFLDTGYLIALFSAKDTFHANAVLLQAQAVRERRRLLTTDAVLFEVGAAFSRVAMRKVGAAIMNTLLHDPNIEVVPLSAAHRDQAVELVTQHLDKDWSLCDCFSFVLMRERGLDQALAADHHFAQAGFEALLLQVP
jgi:predicted nucleic acid-binding protein